MERHRCKLCNRKFANGRALGGHMRSHMMNLPISPKPQISPPSHDTESSSSSSSSSDSEKEDEIEERLLYELRDNPKKSIKLDHEFSSCSVTLQDRESETESSKNPTRRRSKRNRKPALTHNHHQHHRVKNESICNNYYNEATEPVSCSISEVTSEEDVAICLMLLSRDKWECDSHRDNHRKTGGGKYRCDTCNKVFRSYQALGGHRASHKKIRVSEIKTVYNNNNNNNGDHHSERVIIKDEKKIHECPICFRVFGSGQALGGHKRSHVIGIDHNPEANVQSPNKKINENLLDLNLPAPVDDDEVSQIALSAVSDVRL